ncbi:MAG: hypothetical protein OXR73_25575 [Myxococcales bacterium]|nr:hypothetical protein [Myxococcales bacterium]
MTKASDTKDVARSVRARLLNRARSAGEDFQLVLTRYANERLLFRLASSQHASDFVLKGAVLFTLWTGKPIARPAISTSSASATRASNAFAQS